MSTDRTLAALRGARTDWTTSKDAMRWTPGLAPAANPAFDVGAYIDSIRQALRRVAPPLARMVRAVNRTAPAMHRAAHQADLIPGLVSRCRLCRPRANPRPSAHGAAYRQRQLVRRRRRR